MSHGHSHHVEENPKTTSSAAFYFVILLVALTLGLFGFVQSMSHHDEGHGDGHHNEEAAHGDGEHKDAEHKDDHSENKGHTWTHEPSLEYSTAKLTEGKPQHITLQGDNKVSTENIDVVDTATSNVDTNSVPQDGNTAH